MTPRFDQHQIDDLKARHRLSDVLRECGVELRGSGTVTWAKSPFNAERTASFKCDDRRGFWHCFSSGRHGDHLDAYIELGGCNFLAAVEKLGGTRALTPAERQKIDDNKRRLAAADARESERDRRSAREQFEAAVPIRGTLAETYLAARGIVLEPREGADLRFFAALRYRGFVDEADRKGRVLGLFPAMVAAIRNEHGTIIGLHRTYLDPAEPRKMTPPGDPARNRAKKILGEARGMIRLTPLDGTLVMGEGIETTLSAWRLGVGRPDACLAAGVSLGNMAGAAEGRLPHPLHLDDQKRTVPNGIPDHHRPGLTLPDEIDRVILLVDGDSERINTLAHMCTAGQRYADLERVVSLHRAADGQDHNDMLMAALARKAAA